MNKQQLKTSCNSHRLELFLQGRLNSSETEVLELHLTECESCARQIQLNAEQGVSWNEVQSLLTPDEYDSPQHIAAISSLLSDEHDAMTKHQMADVLSREIRGWLDPTDDPRSMGRFAGYEIVGIVGHGGMGIVLKGFEASLNRFVAIKILAPRLATNGGARKRFAREAQAAAAVRHDNVIAIHRVDEWHGLPFLVMPYAGGISLQKRIDSEGPLSIEQTLRVGVQIASGLAAAHAQGLIHRDIKPANILLEQGVERVTITDFGLARAADDASVMRTGVIAGTPQYMSPEQAEAKQLDARSDLFSLGSVLYAMATGRPPFRGAGSFEVLKRIVNEPARPMREIESSVPEWFENIVNRLHAKSPNDRPPSASEVAALLEECLAHVQQPTGTSLPESLTAVAKSDTGNRPSIFNRRFIFNPTRKGVIAMLGKIGMTLLGMTLLGMVLWQETEAPDISGKWTSEEWGTVVLEAKELGRYEGTFTGSDKDKPGYDISDIPVVREGEFAPQPVLTETKLGTVELKWSRVERRFNGTWRKGINRNGRMSLRLVDNEIRGAQTTAKSAEKELTTPRLGDFAWKRNRPAQEGHATIQAVPGSGVMVLKGTKPDVEATIAGLKPLTQAREQEILAAENAFQQLQSTDYEVQEIYNKAVSVAKNDIERQRADDELDPRQALPPKYLAFEEKYRGTPAALKALTQVCNFAESLGDPTCAAAKGRIEAVDRLMNHYLRHDGIETTFDELNAGPEVPRHNEFLQAVLKNNSSRHVQAAALVAQLKVIRDTLNTLPSLPAFAEYVAQLPEPERAASQTRLRMLESIDPDQLRAEANDKIKRLKEYQEEIVAVYGSAANAANQLSRSINLVIIGKPAPEITATTTTGSLFRLSKLRGTTVVLVFGSDRKADSDLRFAPLRKLAAEYKDKVELVMIPANSEDQIQSAAALKPHLPFTVIPQTSNGPIILDWGIEGFPSVYIIDSDGILHSQLHMSLNNDSSGYDTQEVAVALDKLLNDKDGTTVPGTVSDAPQLKGSTADVKAALETLSRRETSEPDLAEKSEASSDDEVSRLLSEIDLLNECEERGANSTRSVRYGAGVMRLTSFGSAAVPRIIEELDRTDDARMIATLAYVLRAIRDKRGVPALIRAIPRTYVPQDDCNWIQSTNVIDKELIAFFRQHKFEGQGDAAIGCSNAMTELSMTLSSLTGAKFALTYTYCRGTPLQIYLQKKLMYKDAERWGKWWEQNSSNMVDDVAYRQAEVPEFNMNSPGIVDPNQTLAEVAWEITYELKSLRGATAANEKYAFEFLDLDTGRNSPAPEQWRDKQLSDADVAKLLAWAANEGFDLTCDQHETEDGTRHYALRGIGLQAWQLDEKSWKDDVLCKWGELATAGRSVVDDWLIPFAREKGVFDPEGKAPFLVVTREGSPVLINVGDEITDDSAKGDVILGFLNDHVGWAKGRRLGIQLFEIAQLEAPPGADDPSAVNVEEAKDVGVSVPPAVFETLEDFLKPGDDKPQAPDQPSLSKTLQQLQGKWRLTRQIAADGDEKITPANTTWEFKGPRIVARDGGPGGVMLIELDESHSPVHVDVALEGADESGLGLLSIEDDKLILCLGVSQKKPELRSRPEELQWVSGVWYMELQRVKPVETIEPVKPIPPNTTAIVSQTAINEAAVEALNMPSDKTSAPTAGDAAHTISGFVMEFRSGTPDVPVCLCDAATGMPVAKDTYKPIVWSRGAARDPANEMAIVVSDSKGNFRFENVPDGKYRLVAQKWMGPYKGVFELHGAEIRLLGAVDEITVPRPADEQESRVVPTPLGENTIQFNQDVGNNETFLFLSTSPPEFDPILGLQGLGTSFWKNLIGVNRMPLGKTTVIGSPNKPVYAFMFAPDNSPGFAAITIPPPESGLVRLPAEPFVAGWSDGRKTPPPKLAELIEFMKTHELSVQQLLNIPEMSNANFNLYQARMQELASDLSRTVELPEGKSARVGDLLAAEAYRTLRN